jgi:hypothetical protein
VIEVVVEKLAAVRRGEELWEAKGSARTSTIRRTTASPSTGR